MPAHRSDQLPALKRPLSHHVIAALAFLLVCMGTISCNDFLLQRLYRAIDEGALYFRSDETLWFNLLRALLPFAVGLIYWLGFRPLYHPASARRPKLSLVWTILATVLAFATALPPVLSSPSILSTAFTDNATLGFVIQTYASLFLPPLALLAVPIVLTQWWAAHLLPNPKQVLASACPICQYDRSGINTDAPCPECATSAIPPHAQFALTNRIGHTFIAATNAVLGAYFTVEIVLNGEWYWYESPLQLTLLVAIVAIFFVNTIFVACIRSNTPKRLRQLTPMIVLNVVLLLVLSALHVYDYQVIYDRAQDYHSISSVNGVVVEEHGRTDLAFWLPNILKAVGLFTLRMYPVFLMLRFCQQLKQRNTH